MSHRKWEGEPVADKRRAKAPDVERLPPHKKPKTWGLILEWTETTTRQMSQQFPSRAARDEARVRIERHFRERAEQEKREGKRQRYIWSGYWASPLTSFKESRREEVKEGPRYIETYEDAPPDNGGESR